jgi:transposase
MPDTTDLLGEIATLKVMLIASEARNLRKDERIERLEKLVAAFRQAAFGRRSEKSDPDQSELALEDLETAIAGIFSEEDTEDRAAKRPAKPRAANCGSLPKHLPRIEEVIEPDSLNCACGGCLNCIGEDVSDRLDIIPAQFRVIVTRRPKYACRSCTDGVIQAPAPARLIPGGLPAEAMVAHVLVSKYADHLPLYRQAQIFTRQGVDLDRSTLADWVGRAAFELRPVHDALMADLKRSTKLFIDETRAPVLDPGARKTKTGYFWALARDDRPWGGTAPPSVAFTDAPGRGGQHAERISRGFGGILQDNGYAGYNRLIAPDRVGPDIQLTYCWAHARRKLIEITRTGPVPHRLPRKAWPSSATTTPSRPTSAAKTLRPALPSVRSVLRPSSPDWTIGCTTTAPAPRPNHRSARPWPTSPDTARALAAS